MLAQKNGAGVTHAFEASFGHGKHANFIDRPKPVLDGAHQPETAVGIAFKIEHGIHHMLQHTGPRQRAFFGHVADQHNAHTAGLGCPREVGGALTHLGDRARR